MNRNQCFVYSATTYSAHGISQRNEIIAFRDHSLVENQTSQEIVRYYFDAFTIVFGLLHFAGWRGWGGFPVAHSLFKLDHKAFLALGKTLTTEHRKV